jgi:hypothetical protein
VFVHRCVVAQGAVAEPACRAPPKAMPDRLTGDRIAVSWLKDSASREGAVARTGTVTRVGRSEPGDAAAPPEREGAAQQGKDVDNGGQRQES